MQDRPDVKTPGRYIVCPPDQPHYPGLHQLGSRDWTSDERDPWPALGETQDSRSYYNGAPPPRFPNWTQIGSDACIQHGERWPLVVITHLVDGFPFGCWAGDTGVPPTRPAQIAVTDRPTAAQLANIADVLYTDAAGAAAMLLNLMGPTATVSFVADSGSTIPGSLIGTSPTQTIVIVSGTSNYQQLALQWLYGTMGITDMGGFSTMSLWFDASSVIADRMNLHGVDTTKPITFVGHSYGGAVGTVLAGRMVYTNPAVDVSILTWGMPRPGDARLYALLQGAPQVHYANEGDPVPALPPTGLELLPFALVVPAPFIQRWEQVQPLPSQVVLAADGTATPTQAPPVNYGVIWAAVNAAVAGTPLGAIFEHQIGVYYDRLKLKP